MAAGPGGVFQGGGGSPMIFPFSTWFGGHLVLSCPACSRTGSTMKKLKICRGVGLPETMAPPPGHGPPEVPTDVGSLQFKSTLKKDETDFCPCLRASFVFVMFIARCLLLFFAILALAVLLPEHGYSVTRMAKFYTLTSYMQQHILTPSFCHFITLCLSVDATLLELK